MTTIEALAEAPNRAWTSITVSFGLVNIPLGVYTGQEDTAVKRHEYFQGDATIPVGRAKVRKDTGEVVEQYDVVYMAEASNGAKVVLTDEEQAACTSPKGLAEVVAFVPVKDLSRYVTEKADQVRPKAKGGKVEPGADKAFALLVTILTKTKTAALIKVAMRGPARYAFITAEGALLYVKPADGLRQPRPMPTYAPSKAEVAMAMTLVDAIGVGTPTITDDTAATVQAFVDAKAQGVEAPKPVEHVGSTPDLMAALEASVAAAKAAAA